MNRVIRLQKQLGRDPQEKYKVLCFLNRPLERDIETRGKTNMNLYQTNLSFKRPGPSCSKRSEHYPLEKTLSNIVSFSLTADLSGGQRYLTSQQLGADNQYVFLQVQEKKTGRRQFLNCLYKAFNLVKTMKPRSIRAENLLGLGILSLHLKSVASMK